MKKKLFLLHFTTLIISLSAQKNDFKKINTKSCEADRQKGIYNVMCFGAKGDNTANDTKAIKETIKAMGSKGGVIFFPEGKYKIYAPITISKSIILTGVSSDSSIIVPYGNFDVFTFTGGASDAGAKDIQIYGEHQTNGTSITINDANNSKFENLLITKPYNAFSISKSKNCSIKESKINLVRGKYGINYFGNDTNKSDGLILENVHLLANSNENSTGILIEGNVHTADIRNLLCSTFGTGIWMKKTDGTKRPSSFQINDLQIDSPLKDAIRIDDAENVFFYNLYTYGSQEADDVIIGENVMNVQMLQGARITTSPKVEKFSEGK